jgi:SAM-dependent methyltransferase
MQTPFADATFKAITSISVIEHGFDAQALLKEMSRLLQPGGYFIASFDYWPEKIDTTGIEFFGMDWLIFSRQEVADFIGQAAEYGLVPDGELHYAGQETPIECAGKKYTFGWLALKKTT